MVSRWSMADSATRYPHPHPHAPSSSHTLSSSRSHPLTLILSLSPSNPLTSAHLSPSYTFTPLIHTHPLILTQHFSPPQILWHPNTHPLIPLSHTPDRNRSHPITHPSTLTPSSPTRTCRCRHQQRQSQRHY